MAGVGQRRSCEHLRRLVRGRESASSSAGTRNGELTSETTDLGVANSWLAARVGTTGLIVQSWIQNRDNMG